MSEIQILAGKKPERTWERDDTHMREGAFEDPLLYHAAFYFPHWGVTVAYHWWKPDAMLIAIGNEAMFDLVRHEIFTVHRRLPRKSLESKL